MKMQPLLLSSAICFLVVAGCNMNMSCENTLVRQSKSPDGQLKAIVFSRGCGATTGETAEVSILPANAPLPSDSGNVFYTDEQNVYVKWLSFSKLQIIVPSKGKIFKKETQYGSVDITYK